MYYKVCKVRDSRNWDSCIKITPQSACRDMNDEYGVTYIKGHWVKPLVKNSSLFVFDTFKSAQNFTKESKWRNCAIFECQVKNPKKIKRFCLSIWQMWTFWNLRQQKKSVLNVRTAEVIKGTVICSAVKLGKMVEDCKN